MKEYDRIVYTTAEGIELGGVFLFYVERPYWGEFKLAWIHLDTQERPLAVDSRDVRPFGYETPMNQA